MAPLSSAASEISERMSCLSRPYPAQQFAIAEIKVRSAQSSVVILQASQHPRIKVRVMSTSLHLQNLTSGNSGRLITQQLGTGAGRRRVCETLA